MVPTPRRVVIGRLAASPWHRSIFPNPPISKPAYIAAPANDRIVPPESALAIARDLPDVTVVQPNRGHIGMMAGGGAQKTVWEPLVAWLRQA